VAASHHGDTPYSGKTVTSVPVTPYTTSVDVNAAEPTVREHVIEESSKVSSLVHKFTHSGIDSSMVPIGQG
jgi:hypothetical protein